MVPTPLPTARSAAERPLGRFETALTLTGDHAPFVVVVVLRLAGGTGGEMPDHESLRRALDALQARHPLLRARIVRRGRRYVLVGGGAPPIPLRHLPRHGEASWRGAAEEELNRAVDREGGPLMRCTLLRSEGGDRDGGDGGGGDCELVLTFHHAIMDAVCGATLVDELLGLLAGGADPAPGDAATLPPPVEDAFPARFRGPVGGLRLAAFVARQAADELRYRRRCRGLRRPPVVETARCRVLPVELSAAASAGLVRSSRRRRVTLNGVLNAAMLLAVHRHLYAGERRPLRYITFADLRPYLRPPPPPERLGCAVTMLRYTADLAPSSEPWPLAEAISRQVNAGGRRGEPFLALRLSAPMMRATLRRGDRRMAASAVSYSGVARFGEGALAVRGSHAFVSNLGLGPELTAQARWFRDRLQLDFVYLDSDLDEARARALVDDVLATLTAAGEEAGETIGTVKEVDR